MFVIKENTSNNLLLSYFLSTFARWEYIGLQHKFSSGSCFALLSWFHPRCIPYVSKTYPICIPDVSQVYPMLLTFASMSCCQRSSSSLPYKWLFSNNDVLCVTNPPPLSHFDILLQWKQLCCIYESVVACLVRPFQIRCSAQASIDESLYPFRCFLCHSPCFKLYSNTELTFD